MPNELKGFSHRELAQWHRRHMRINALHMRDWAVYETKQASEASRLLCQEYAKDNFDRAVTNRDKALHHERYEN